MPSFRHFVRMVLAILLLAGWALGQSENDTKSETPAPAKHTRHVITNDDIPPRPEPEPAAAGKPAGAPATPEAVDKSAALSKVGLATEDDVRQAVEQIRKREIALQEKLHRLKDKLVNEDDDFRRQMWADALENQKTTLEQYRKVREKLEQELHPQDQAKPAASAATGS